MQVVGRILLAMYYKSIKSQVGRMGTILLLIFGFSVTSRRGLPTSRRQFNMSLSHRDVDFPRRDISFYKSLSGRDVTPHVATSLSYLLSHVATSTRTSRRWLHYSLSRRDVTPHVATWPCFKPKRSSFLALHLPQPTT